MLNFWNFKTIKNETGDEKVELRIAGDIVSDDWVWIYEWLEMECAAPNKFRSELKKYDGKDIDVWIDSYGGDVFAAAGIYNALKNHNGKITTKIDGKAMSAASVIAMAGDEILMSPLAIMMIHNPLTRASGNMHDLRKVADTLDIVKDTIINAYASKTNISREKISSMMDDETWMSANVAIKNGFADGVLFTDDDELLEINNIKDFKFNRISIENSVKNSIDEIIKINNDTNGDLEEIQLEKEKLKLKLKLGGI